MSTKLWDAETGKDVSTLNHKAPARWVEFAEGDRQFLIVTDQVMGEKSTVHVHSVESDGKGTCIYW